MTPDLEKWLTGIFVVVFIIGTISFSIKWFREEKRRILGSFYTKRDGVWAVGFAVGIPPILIATLWFKSLIGINANTVETIFLSLISFLIGKVISQNLTSHWDKEEGPEDLKWMSTNLYSELSTARKKLVLVQTWYPDAAPIIEYINANGDHENLKLDIYMLHPNSQHGQTRYHNLYSSGESCQGCGLGDFRTHAISSLDNIMIRLRKTRKLKCSLFLYDTYPERKIYNIDDERYFTVEYSTSVSTKKDVQVIHSRSTDQDEVKMLSEIKDYMIKISDGIEEIIIKNPGDSNTAISSQNLMDSIKDSF